VLYEAWTHWCEEQHRDHPGTSQSFGRDLRAVVPDLEVAQPREPISGKRIRYYQGIGLLP
jgi:putative DNA primase/helicase